MAYVRLYTSVVCASDPRDLGIAFNPWGRLCRLAPGSLTITLYSPGF